MRLFSLKSAAILGIASMGLFVSGCLTDDDKDPDPVDPGATDSVSSKTVTLGAQSNAAAGSIDLDTWATYTMSQGVTKYPDIDIVFAYSTSSSEASIYSPNIAKNGVSGSSGGFDFMASWPNANTTPLKIPASGFNLANVHLASEIKAAYDAGTDPSVLGKVPVSVGTVVLVKTDKGLYLALKVTAVTASASGTLSLTGTAMW